MNTIHLVYPPKLLHKFSRDDYNTQEKLERMVVGKQGVL